MVYSLSRARDTSSNLFLDVSAGRDGSRWTEGAPGGPPHGGFVLQSRRRM